MFIQRSWLILCLPSLVWGHGYMYSPRSLNWIANQDGKMWGEEAGVPAKEHCFHCLNNKQTSGICGDSGSMNYDHFVDSEGNPMPWNSEEIYEEGQIITVKSFLSTHHYGHLEMRLCQNGDSPSLECMNKHVLEFVDDPKYNAPKDPSNPHHGHLAEADKDDYEMRFKLPTGVSGEKILLQWKYITANSCNPPGYLEYPWPNVKWWAGPYLLACTLPYLEHGILPRPGDKPEQFWNCAQVTINATSDPTPTIKPNPSPTVKPEPTTSPAPTSKQGDMCCSWDLKNCGKKSFCNKSPENCEICKGLLWIKRDSCPGYALNKSCTLFTDACCSPAKCQGTHWYKKCTLTGPIDQNPDPPPTPPSPTSQPSSKPTVNDKENQPTESPAPSIFPSKAPSSSPDLTAIPSVGPTSSPAPTTPSVDKTVIGYYASWQWYRRNQLSKPENMDFSKVDRVHFAFFQTDTDGKLFGTDDWADPILLYGPLDWRGDYQCSWVKADEKLCQNHNTEKGLIHLAHAAGTDVYPSIGGWTLSDAFPAMASNEISRTEFANQCVGLIQEYDFDGIDIDWEYPGYAAHSGTADDKVNFNLLMDEVRSKLDALTETTNKEYGLTAALPCGPSHINNIDIGHIAGVLNELNLMTYDLHGPWDSVTGVNAPLYYQGWGHTDLSVEKCVQKWVDGGASPSSISIGLPFYGRGFLNADGLNKPHNGIDEVHWDEDDGMPLYFNILDQLDNMDTYRHDTSKTQYAIFKDKSGLISYDDEQAICDKTEYVINEDLSGFIIWEMSGDLLEDLSTPLLDKVNDKLKNPDLDCSFELTNAPTSSPAPTPSGPTCPSGYTGLKAYDQCAKYYHCVGGVVTGPLYPCPTGTIFNEAIQVCDWENNVAC